MQRLGPVGLFESGAHLSDFEYVGVVLSASGKPRYAFMSRHTAKEGRPFLWEDAGLEHVDGAGDRGKEDHLRIAVCHANYERCGHQPRDGEGALGFMGVNAPFDDHADCGGARIGPATRLVDLARVPWACWPGGYGRGQAGLLERLLPGALTAAAPQSPLQQQRFGDKRATPCRGVDDPRERRVDTEERLPASAADALSNGAGRIESWVDNCGDWSKPRFTGAILVACDRRRCGRTSRRGSSACRQTPCASCVTARARGKPTTIPAVGRDRDSAGALRRWHIAGTGASVTVYAARRNGRTLKAALFTRVRVKRGQRLRVIDTSARRWQLVDEEMKVVCSATVGSREPRPAECR